MSLSYVHFMSVKMNDFVDVNFSNGLECVYVKSKKSVHQQHVNA